MFNIIKNGTLLSVEDKSRYVKMQRNGILRLCTEEEAHGIVVNNEYACHLEGRPALPGLDTVTLHEFSGAQKIDSLTTEGAKIAQSAATTPAATVGVFAEGFAEWKPGAVYAKMYSLFTYNGKVGFTRQANITAQAHQPPFSTGMESVYGIRPVPDETGIYPYTRNMAASVGMAVREGNAVYDCIQVIDVMLNPPSQIPAHFTKRKED